MLSHWTCITSSHDTVRKLDLKIILALGFSAFITRDTIYGRWLFWLAFKLISLSLVYCFIWLLTYRMWIMFCFCLPKTLPMLVLITQRRRDVIFLDDLLVINFLLYWIFSTKFLYRLKIPIKSRINYYTLVLWKKIHPINEVFR